MSVVRAEPTAQYANAVLSGEQTMLSGEQPVLSGEQPVLSGEQRESALSTFPCLPCRPVPFRESRDIPGLLPVPQ
jgi:hypothetical protein